MSTNNDDSYSNFHMSEEEFAEMLLEGDYDPATDACGLLWPIMAGIFAEELADFVIRKGAVGMED